MLPVAPEKARTVTRSKAFIAALHEAAGGASPRHNNLLAVASSFRSVGLGVGFLGLLAIIGTVVLMFRGELGLIFGIGLLTVQAVVVVWNRALCHFLASLTGVLVDTEVSGRVTSEAIQHLTKVIERSHEA